MSDSYNIDGVTVTPQGGGWYLLSHPSLPEPVKEQGKEDADARAKAIAATFKVDEDDMVMAPQGALDVAAVAQVKDKDAEIADLKAKLAMATRTAVVSDEPAQPAKITGAVPRKYDGILDDKAKAELKRLGVETTEIVLEENETIPPTGLFLGHNGRGYVIVPGEPVTVPNFLLGVLDDAVMSAPILDQKSGKTLGWRNRSRYPYRRL